MRLGLVVPRYGVDVVGGTEHWLRLLCEHLVAMRQWDVEVFTTCATSAATWSDELPPGDSVLAGVTVHRHRSVSGRDPRYAELNTTIRQDPAHVPDDVARRFVELVGPVCPAVLDQAATSDCDLIALTPYLFWPSVVGAPRLGRRVIFHGAAHDEPELHLPIMGEVFLSVGGFAFNSYAERALVERTFAIAHLPAAVIGNTVTVEEGDPAAARDELGLGADEPFVLCLGRVERDKGSLALADLWRHYRRRHREAPRLVFLGPVHEPLASDSDVLVAGHRSEAVKWGALRACEFLIAPSPWESFSLVVLEAWLAGRPVLVNGHCQATVEQCRRSGGGLWFSDVVEFDVTVDRLLADPSLRTHLSERGGRYARRQFSWTAVVDRYALLVERILTTADAPGPRRTRPAPL
jgi:glycosyltransferase involved in cell wall biosynthesis